jgi:hypothetical protein
MLLDLENIDEVFTTKDGDKARTIKASALGWHSPQESGNCAQETWKGRRF